MKYEESPYKNKFWTDNYDEFVPSQIDIKDFSMGDMLTDAVKEFPNGICYDFMVTTATYRELESNAIKFANFLLDHGITKGDRIAIHLPNTPQYLVALFGTFYAGATAMGMSILFRPPEIVYQLQDSGAQVLVTLDQFYEENVRDALLTEKTEVELVVTTNAADMMEINKVLKWIGKLMKKIPSGKVEPVAGIEYDNFKDKLKKNQGNKAPEVPIDPETDLAFLQYTGGTTGPPKGAKLTHANEAANLQQVFKWIEKNAQKGEEIFLSAFPFFHLAGMFLNLGAVYYCSTQILVPDPRDMKHYLKKIEEYHPTLFAAVPTLYLYLLNEEGFREIDLSSFRGYISGAAPLAEKTIKDLESVVGKNKVIEVYGMTEAAPIVTGNPFEGKRKIGTVGLPIPNTELKIVEFEDRNKVVPLDTPGEVVIRGPQMFHGYWKKPKETEKALDNGWFYSGDVGVMDKEGYVKIVDRTKDMIIVSGYKVFSVEVNDKMSKHPAIELCSTVGVDDPEKPGSERVKLYVKLKSGYKNTKETKDDILSYAKENLAPYKVPKIIEITEDIPLTAVGKIDKKVLRAREKDEGVT